ncbi:MAG: MFS transporter [Desulfobacterota bacterium]|nr:MFS transporter [Thermodesulfobacteriota bacterium]
MTSSDPHPSPSLFPPVKKREIFGWAMYDFGNSAFATTILSVIFNHYFATVVAGGEKGVDLLGFRLHGASFFTFSVSLSMLISAILAPFLGAVADTSASKKRFLMVFCYLGVLFTGLLFFVGEGDHWKGAIFFILANLGFAGGNVYYNAFLPEISTDRNIGRISGLGWALGYIGGGALLALNLMMLQYPETIGFPKGTFTVQDCFLSVALWWFVFSLPLFLLLRERAEKTPLDPGKNYFTLGYLRLRHTFKRIRTFRELTKFLAAFLIYNEGIETVIVMASIFGAEVIRMETGEIILFFLLVQGIAFLGSLLFGFLADALGNKRTIMISLAIWSLIVVWAFQLGIFWDPKTEYWILGILTGIVLGGSQASSRSLQGLFTPDANSAEFYGFFAVSGKFASVFGPLIYGILIALTGDVQSGILSVLAFFVAGGILLWQVDEKKGMEEREHPIL